jgi:hypothetical protein
MQRSLHENTTQDLSHVLDHHSRAYQLPLLVQDAKTTVQVSQGIIHIIPYEFYPSEYQAGHYEYFQGWLARVDSGE